MRTFAPTNYQMNRSFSDSRTVFYLFMLLVFFAPITNYASAIDTASLLVKTKQGTLRGMTKNDICIWKGIPYATTPSGDLRFRAPQPPKAWTGVKDATAFSYVAPQPKMPVADAQPQSEDCLSLNIWSPAADGKKRPVMFWIHGGGLIVGSGSSTLYDGTPLVKAGDVVVVTINYRLGPLGFLYFDNLPNHESFDNNLGIKDQVAALQWVKENIAAFGGDPNAVTIFGESAGGLSVLTLMGTPAAKGLFRGVIAESGLPESLWKPATANYVTQKYLKIVGVSPDSLFKLRAISSDTLNYAMQLLVEQLSTEPTPYKTLSPTIDGKYIPTDLMTAIRNRQAEGVSLLIGTNRNEVNILAKIKQLGAVPQTAKELVPYMSALKADEQKRITDSYNKYPHKSSILDMITDGIFTIPCIRFAELQSTIAPTYMYRFDWSSGILKLLGLRACHGLEMPFVFGTFESRLGKKFTTLANKKQVKILSTVMMQAWINFAKTGNPNPAGRTDWQSYNSTARSTRILDKKIYTINDPKSKERKAWTGLSIF